MSVFRGLFCAPLFFGFFVLAQTPKGEIRLQVNDSTGAPMKASGILRIVSTGTARNFETDTQGSFDFTDLAYGSYRLQVSQRGFNTETLAIAVQSATPITRTVTMKIGAQSAKVDVVEATPLAGTDLAEDQIPGLVQTATAEDLKSSGALNLSDFMNRKLNGVFINDMAGSSFQRM
jgi:hypothetical protein